MYHNASSSITKQNTIYSGSSNNLINKSENTDKKFKNLLILKKNN